MIDLMTLPAGEAEKIAYAEGFAGTARIFARLEDMQRALGEATAEIENLKYENAQLARDIARLEQAAA